MRYLPLLWAGLFRRKTRTILTLLSIMVAFALFGLLQAVKIAFDDGHDTGIYSWVYLRELGEQQAEYWRRYLDELKISNVSRLSAIAVGQWRPPQGSE